MNGRRIHITAEESSSGRVKKKLLGKSSWYKDRSKVIKEESAKEPTRGKNVKKTVEDRDLKTRAVLFVEQTPGGELAKKIRDQLQHMGSSLGFRIRVVERTGRNILSNFPQTSTWRGLVCGREDCITCHQGGEEKPDCTRVNLVYENICLKCNPGPWRRGSLYVGETSRSIQ